METAPNLVRMTVTETLLVRLRTLKLALAPRGAMGRAVVPLVEVAEVWLADGSREVVRRVRLRVGPRPLAPPVSYVPVDHTESLPSVSIPPWHGPHGVSIVIPVIDKLQLTMTCLQSIVAHTVPGSYEVIVVDNGSTEPTQAALGAVDGLRLIRNDSNVGFVGACNQGGRAARGKYVLFLNNDTVALPGWLDALVGTLERDPRAAAVGAKLIYPDGRLQEAGAIIWRDGSGWNYGRGADRDAPEYCYVREVDYCSGACLLVRRDVLEQLGGFDNRYAPAYYEDTDLCFRIRELGYRVLYQPRSEVIHLEGATAGTDVAQGVKRFQDVNRHKFAERHSAALAAQQPPDPRLLHQARDRKGGKRILVVDHMLPHHDQDSGSVRMTAILRILVELGHRVTFLPDNLCRIEPYASELQQIGIEVLYGPLAAVDYVVRHVNEFDVVILCRAYFAMKYLSTVAAAERRPILVFDTVDLHHLREQRRAELENDAALARCAAQTRSVELSVMHASDVIWVTSTHEYDVVRGYDPSLRVEIVPNIHAVRDSVPPFSGRRNMLFIGGFRHPPNEDAVLYFVSEILPLVKRRLPDVQLLIVGSHVTPAIRALESNDVRVLGHVKDVEPIFDRCRLSVAPLRYGAGVKGKISQSLAWGLPVVTTPVGAEGMHLTDGEHAAIAATPSEFARRLVEVYESEPMWTRLSDNGRQHVRRHLGDEAVRARIDASLRQAAPAPCQAGSRS
jgi:O-antigen biosynthesis protein